MKITRMLAVVAAVLATTNVAAIAGGPAMLWIPIDGVADSAKVAETLTEHLNDHVWKHPGRFEGVRLRQDGKQSYLTYYMGAPVDLSDLQTAAKAADVKLQIEELRVFGHVTLVVDAKQANHQTLVTAIENLDRVAVGKSELKDGMLIVHIDMPYPACRRGNEGFDIAWDRFHWCDFSSDQTLRRQEEPATADQLPTIQDFRKTINAQGAKLADVRWDSRFGCRPLGATVVKK